MALDIEQEKAKAAGRMLQAMRKTKSGGKHGGRPATIPHVEGGDCRCVGCRKAKGWSPYGKVAEETLPWERGEVKAGEKETP